MRSRYFGGESAIDNGNSGYYNAAGDFSTLEKYMNFQVRTLKN